MNSDNGRMLTDDQVDSLLTGFFRHEVPAKLADLPSKWVDGPGNAPTVVTSDRVHAAGSRNTQESRLSAGSRNAAVVVAMMTVCGLLVLVSNEFRSAAIPDAAVQETDENSSRPTAVNEPDRLMNVSQNPNGGTPLDDTNLTLDELDGVELSPVDRTSQDRKNSSDGGKTRSVE